LVGFVTFQADETAPKTGPSGRFLLSGSKTCLIDSL